MNGHGGGPYQEKKQSKTYENTVQIYVLHHIFQSNPAGPDWSFWWANPGPRSHNFDTLKKIGGPNHASKMLPEAPDPFTVSVEGSACSFHLSSVCSLNFSFIVTSVIV